MPQQKEKMKLMNRLAVWLWRLLYTPLFRQASRQVLQGRIFDPLDPQKGRWLKADIKEFLKHVWVQVDFLMPIARLDELPNFGNRHNVYLAVVTSAAYQVLLRREVNSDYANVLIGDVGWKIYSWMLKTISLPYRIFVRDQGKRMEKTLRTMMIFPFSAPGAPGYEGEIWTDGSDTYTHWTHCPPQTFVRRLINENGDHGELDAFYNSWCLYDWPGADIIVNDGLLGHYSRTKTLSRGHKVCDMCWHGYVSPQPAH